MATKTTRAVDEKRGEILAELREVQEWLHKSAQEYGYYRSRWFAGVYSWVTATNSAEGCGLERARARLAKTLDVTPTQILIACNVGQYMASKKLNPRRVNGCSLQNLYINKCWLTAQKEASILAMIRADKPSRDVSSSIRRGAARRKSETAGKHLSISGKLKRGDCMDQLRKARSYWRWLQDDEDVSVYVYNGDGEEIACLTE